MHNVGIAEWILSLVTAPERAATTAGDLAEEASTRGVVWVWWNVWRTAWSLLWCDLQRTPWRMVRLALLGGWANAVIGSVFAIIVLNVWTAVHLVQIGPNATGVPAWGYTIVLAVSVTAVPRSEEHTTELQSLRHL